MVPQQETGTTAARADIGSPGGRGVPAVPRHARHIRPQLLPVLVRLPGGSTVPSCPVLISSLDGMPAYLRSALPVGRPGPRRAGLQQTPWHPHRQMKDGLLTVAVSSLPLGTTPLSGSTLSTRSTLVQTTRNLTLGRCLSPVHASLPPDMPLLLAPHQGEPERALSGVPQALQ